MKKVLAIYFSGTGNSKKVLDLASEVLVKKGYDIDVVDVCKDEIKDLNQYDILLVSYPIYAFNTPVPVISYVKRLAKAKKSLNCLILKNSGEHLFWNNVSSLQLKRILRSKGVTTFSEYHYLMPYSFVFRHSDYMAYRMISAVKGRIALDIYEFLNGKMHQYKWFFMERPFAVIFRIQRFGGRFNGRFYKVNDNCTKCNKCINNCPAHNISIVDGKLKFGKHCLMCQKCAMYCPNQAISVGLFKRWQVGGAYSFKEQLEFQKELKPKFCAKSYKKYFEECENRSSANYE